MLNDCYEDVSGASRQPQKNDKIRSSSNLTNVRKCSLYIIPRYDGNPILLSTFISIPVIPFTRCTTDDQRILTILHMTNNLLGRFVKFINSSKPLTLEEIKLLLETHVGDFGNSASLIPDLQHIHQSPNESLLTLVSTLQNYNAKVHSRLKTHLCVFHICMTADLVNNKKHLSSHIRLKNSSSRIPPIMYASHKTYSSPIISCMQLLIFVSAYQTILQQYFSSNAYIALNINI